MALLLALFGNPAVLCERGLTIVGLDSISHLPHGTTLPSTACVCR